MRTPASLWLARSFVSAAEAAAAQAPAPPAARRAPRFRAVLFDATGTLMAPAEPAAEV